MPGGTAVLVEAAPVSAGYSRFGAWGRLAPERGVDGGKAPRHAAPEQRLALGFARLVHHDCFDAARGQGLCEGEAGEVTACCFAAAPYLWGGGYIVVVDERVCFKKGIQTKQTREQNRDEATSWHTYRRGRKMWRYGGLMYGSMCRM